MIKNTLFLTLVGILGFAMCSHAAGVIGLPQTGQTKCYDAVGDQIPCAGTGQDGNTRAGVAWPSPRFTAGTGAEAACMIDNLTGLMWPLNGNLAGAMMSWDDAVDFSNNLSLCGHDDWRLPNVNEIESLINGDEENSATWLNGLGFTNVQSYHYWSSTTDPLHSEDAFIVAMWRGFVKSSEKSFLDSYVWPVRDGSDQPAAPLWKTGQTASYRSGDDGDLQRGVAWPSPRFKVTGDCVTDKLTGLVWARNANLFGAGLTWQEALNYADDLRLCNRSDWRLPNRKELMSLLDRSRQYPALPADHPFVNVQLGYYWSSTTFMGLTSSAWTAGLDSGIVWPWYGDKDSLYFSVWPVTGGTTHWSDLVETSVSDPPLTASAGDSFQVTDTVKNQGNEDSGASATRYYFSATGSKPGAKLLTGARSIPALKPGATSTGTVDLTIPSGINSGIYYLVACADDEKAVAEENEVNNCRASAATIDLSAPDLVVTSLSDPPLTALTGSSFPVTDTVKNQGDADADASVNRYFLSLTTSRTGAKILWGFRLVPVLAQNETSTKTIRVTVPSSVPAGGPYYLLACADYGNKVPESIESNNCTPSGSTVTITAAPDLVETSVSSPPPEAVSGTQFSVTDTVKNIGNANETSPTTTRYYLSTTTRRGGAKLLKGARSVPPLAIGASSEGSADVTISSGISSGTYYLLACSDDLRAATEGIETNNCLASSSTVTLTTPDLVESAISDPPATASLGDTFPVTDTVENKGDADAGASKTIYYLSVSPTKGSDATRLGGSRSVEALSPGATSSQTVNVKIFDTTVPGTYYLIACADGINDVSEGNEANNCLASATTVEVQP